MPLPEMTPEQRAAALEKARIVRQQRSEAMDKLAHGKIKPVDFLDNTDPVYAKVKVAAFLKKLPGVGPATATKVMEQFKIAENKRLAGLTKVQKENLITWIQEHVKF